MSTIYTYYCGHSKGIGGEFCIIITQRELLVFIIVLNDPWILIYLPIQLNTLTS